MHQCVPERYPPGIGVGIAGPAGDRQVVGCIRQRLPTRSREHTGRHGDPVGIEWRDTPGLQHHQGLQPVGEGFGLGGSQPVPQSGIDDFTVAWLRQPGAEVGAGVARAEVLATPTI